MTEPKSKLSPEEQAANIEALALTEKELKDLIDDKKQIEKRLVDLETNLYNLETTYLEDTAGFGNIIKGFDSYLNGRAIDKRRSRFFETDRIFSNSSTTTQKSIDLKEREERELLLQQQNSENEFNENEHSPIPFNKKKKRNIDLDGTFNNLGENSDSNFTVSNKRKRQRVEDEQ
ncbi:Chromatin modification- protein meaf6 [Clydaea vesicula]|uniref:Chromatin modification-related protein EAF6 n=1 Tax=Clydaea vesicula TaxID=447962 RepID=A0AAD5XW64_9FUNG|nr:Chromatin modification- protein meaf6 [Clydaea vesicula]KAJ3396831.1 Chromatin modification- protein meaf6 [Lobulomyces angularis]